MFGLFISSVGPSSLEINNQNSSSKQTVKTIFKEMGSKTWSSAKNLGMVAGLFSGIECLIETYRAKHDIYNTITSGCLSGAILGAKGSLFIFIICCVTLNSWTQGSSLWLCRICSIFCCDRAFLSTK